MVLLDPPHQLRVHGLPQGSRLLSDFLEVVEFAEVGGEGVGVGGQILGLLGRVVEDVLLGTLLEVEIEVIVIFGLFGRVGVLVLHDINFNNIFKCIINPPPHHPPHTHHRRLPSCIQTTDTPYLYST